MRAALPYIGCQKAGGTSESLKLLLIQGKDIRTAVRMSLPISAQKNPPVRF